ncbi:unnamed protein product [Malus baccata var. baccata]
MAVDTQQWAVEQPQSRSVFEMSNSSSYVTTQIEKMEKMLDAKFDMLLQRIPSSQVVVQQPLQAACSICNMITHDFMSCPHKDFCPDFTAEQVQQPAAPKAAWEVAIEKLANTTTQEIQNLQTAMKNMKKQIGQIALQVSERVECTFPIKQYLIQEDKKNAMLYILYDSAISAYSWPLPDRSENTAEATTKTAEYVYEPPMPYPERLKPKAKDQQLTYFMKTLAKVQINIPLINAIKNIPSYAKCEGKLKPTSSIIQLADRSITYPRGVIEVIIVKVDNLYLPADFMVLDMDEDLTTPIILGRPFLATARTLIDVEAKTLTFRVKDQTVVFKLFEASIHSGDKQECMRVDALDGLPSTEFMNRSSTDHLSIKPPNLTRDCTSPKPQQQRVLHDDQPINTMKKHENFPGESLTMKAPVI